MKFGIGDKVYWNDPDEGICSGEYMVIDVNRGEEPIYYLDCKGSMVMAYEHELESL